MFTLCCQLSATPKEKTLEMFGTKQPDGHFEPFHVYSMRQAIEEGFINLNFDVYLVLPIVELVHLQHLVIHRQLRLPVHNTQMFGTKQPDGHFEPFHVYSMRQAIEEGFILDVLKNYSFGVAVKAKKLKF
jgi:type I site-specific restriction endonuclease